MFQIREGKNQKKILLDFLDLIATFKLSSITFKLNTITKYIDIEQRGKLKISVQPDQSGVHEKLQRIRKLDNVIRLC